MKKRVLFVEDEQGLHEVMQRYLESEGYKMDSSYDGEEVFQKVDELDKLYDAVILDLMLPGKNGLEILKEIRKKSSIPVIILTAMGEEVDKLLGLELGADDYVVKPFSPREVVARLKAVLRRLEVSEKKSDQESRIEFGEYVVDKEEKRVYWKGMPISFTATELRIIFKLSENPNRVFTRAELVDVISDEYEVDDRVIDAHVKNIRKKTSNVNAPDLIETVRGFGYTLSREIKK